MTAPHQVHQTHLPPKVTRCDLAGAKRHRAPRCCRGNGRFPCTGMTGSPAKIVASAPAMRIFPDPEPVTQVCAVPGT